MLESCEPAEFTSVPRELSRLAGVGLSNRIENQYQVRLRFAAG